MKTKRNNRVESLPLTVEERILQKLEKIDDKINDLSDDVNELKITSTKHDLKIEEIKEKTKSISDTLKPIDAHVKHIHGAFKLLGVTGLIVSIAAGLARVYGVI